MKRAITSELTSHANPRVKAVVRLRDRREREATGLTIVDGAREIGRALDAGVESRGGVRVGRMATGAERRDARINAGSTSGHASPGSAEPLLDQIAFGDRSDGIVAVVAMPSSPPPTTSSRRGPSSP